MQAGNTVTSVFAETMTYLFSVLSRVEHSRRVRQPKKRVRFWVKYSVFLHLFAHYQEAGCFRGQFLLL